MNVTYGEDSDTDDEKFCNGGGVMEPKICVMVMVNKRDRLLHQRLLQEQQGPLP